MQLPSLTRWVRGMLWVWTGLFQVFSWNHRPVLPPGSPSLCCVGLVPAAPGRTKCADAHSSRRTVIAWGLHSLSVRHPFSLDVQLLSGAYILSVCSILKDTLLGTVSLPKQWTEKEQYVRARLDNSWVAARNNFPHSLTYSVSWLLVHGTMSVGGLPAIFVWLWQERKWRLSLWSPPWLLSLIPSRTAKDLVPIHMDTWPSSLSPIHILHQKPPLRPRGA